MRRAAFHLQLITQDLTFMPLTASALTEDRRDQALALVTSAFDGKTSYDYFESHQSLDPLWDVSQSLVIQNDASIMAHLWLAKRTLRYGLGRINVGCIADVAVDPEHRRKGHAGLLLDEAIQQMQLNNQPLSLLSAGTPEVYSSRGWHPIPTSRLEAELPSGNIEWSGGHTVRPFEPGDLLEVQRAYDEISADRVGPLDRSDAYWTAMHRWLQHHQSGIDVHFDVLLRVGKVVGYAITSLSDQAVTILDGGIEYDDLALPLLRTWRDRATKRNVTRITGELDPASKLFDVLRKRAAGRIEPTTHYMVRLNSLRLLLESAVPEFVRRRRRAAPLPGPTFVLDVEGQQVRIETPIGNIVIGDPVGDEPVINLTNAQFLDLFLGLTSGHKVLDEIAPDRHIDVYLRRLFPASPFSYWLADRF